MLTTTIFLILVIVAVLGVRQGWLEAPSQASINGAPLGADSSNPAATPGTALPNMPKPPELPADAEPSSSRTK